MHSMTSSLHGNMCPCLQQIHTSSVCTPDPPQSGRPMLSPDTGDGRDTPAWGPGPPPSQGRGSGGREQGLMALLLCKAGRARGLRAAGLSSWGPALRGLRL